MMIAPSFADEVFTRQQYLDGACTHRQFYAQGVTPCLRGLVAAHFGADALHRAAALSEHLSSIPLDRWDALAPRVRPYAARLHRLIGYGGGVSLSDCVCLAKEAALQVAERGALVSLASLSTLP